MPAILSKLNAEAGRDFGFFISTNSGPLAKRRARGLQYVDQIVSWLTKKRVPKHSKSGIAQCLLVLPHTQALMLHRQHFSIHPQSSIFPEGVLRTILHLQSAPASPGFLLSCKTSLNPAPIRPFDFDRADTYTAASDTPNGFFSQRAAGSGAPSGCSALEPTSTTSWL